MSKTDLRARPMSAQHTMVFTALALAREVQARTGLPIRNVTSGQRPLRSATTLAINGTQQKFGSAIPDDQQAILEAIRGPRLTH